MMYDINFKNFKSTKNFGIIFTIFGLFFLLIIGGLFVGNIVKKSSLDAQITAHDIEWKTINGDDGITYSPIYYYNVDGVEYTCDANSSSSSKNGKGIVYYNSTNPQDCMTDFESSFSFIFLLFSLIPIVFVLIGASQIKRYIKKLKDIKTLANTGILVKGVPYLVTNSSYSVNDRPIKCFKASYTFPDGKTKELVSPPAFDRVLQDGDGRCDLLYDPNNYDNYFLDLEIKVTGQGNPRIIQYDQDYQNTNNIISDNINNDFNYNNYNYESNSYNPGDKFR